VGGGDEVLAGGLANAGAVVRRGEVVVRPAPPHAGALHAYLRALRAAGFDGVPSPLGVDGDREELAFIPGDVPIPPFPAWSDRDDVLTSVAGLLRRYHDAARTVPLPRGIAWPADFADPVAAGARAVGGEAAELVLCHTDVCPENVVFRSGRAVALIDFDFASPGRPIWDVAMAARYWAPMVDPISAAIAGREHLDPGHRLRVLADGYGLGADDRAALVAVVAVADRVGRSFVEARVARGEPAFVETWERYGRWERWDRKAAWLAANRDRLTAALLV
jgi:hypothetical protein